MLRCRLDFTLLLWYLDILVHSHNILIIFHYHFLQFLASPVLISALCLQIKPKVGTVCFGVAASQGALLLAGGEKGMRYAMPNARIMIHQPQSGCGV